MRTLSKLKTLFATVIIVLPVLSSPDTTFAQRVRVSFEGTLNGSISDDFSAMSNQSVAGFVDFDQSDAEVAISNRPTSAIFELHSTPRFEVLVGDTLVASSGSLIAYVADASEAFPNALDVIGIEAGGESFPEDPVQTGSLFYNGVEDERTFMSLTFSAPNDTFNSTDLISEISRFEVGQSLELFFAIPATGLGGGSVVINSVTAIPEPTSFAMIAFATSGIALLRKRKS